MLSTTTRVFAIDPMHSSIHFAVRHMMVSKVRGSFHTFSGTIEMPEVGDVPVAARVSIDAASIDTGIAQRDGHLRSRDFLDVERYPQLRFVSSEARGTGTRDFVLAGMLELRGTAKAVAIAATASGGWPDPANTARVGFEGKLTINRRDWGLTWNQALEAGGVVVGDEIEITIDIAAVVPEVDDQLAAIA